jgi:hypothetical protein
MCPEAGCRWEGPQRGPVPPRILEQCLVLRHPDVPALAQPAVEDDAGNLPALPRTGAIAQKVAHAVGRALGIGDECAALVLGAKLARQIARMGARSVDQRFGLCCG